MLGIFLPLKFKLFIICYVIKMLLVLQENMNVSKFHLLLLLINSGCNTYKAEPGFRLHLVVGIPVVGIADLLIIK